LHYQWQQVPRGELVHHLVVYSNAPKFKLGHYQRLIARQRQSRRLSLCVVQLQSVWEERWQTAW